MKFPNLLRIPLVGAVIPAAILTFAACGDDDAEPTATPSAAATSPATTAASATPATQAASPTSASATRTPVPGTAVPATATSAPGVFSAVTKGLAPTGFEGNGLLRDVRIGAHPEDGGFDRIVFEFTGALPRARIEYVSSAAACGSGQPVTVPGAATLLVTFDEAAAHNNNGQVTFGSQTVAGARTILQARQTCDFEALLSWALGVSSRQPFTVSQLDNPYRLVVDVKQ